MAGQRDLKEKKGREHENNSIIPISKCRIETPTIIVETDVVLLRLFHYNARLLSCFKLFQ